MQGLCYELDGNFQFPARLIPILVDYNSLVHTIERYPIWAYGSLGQSVQYTKVKRNNVLKVNNFLTVYMYRCLFNLMADSYF